MKRRSCPCWFAATFLCCLSVTVTGSASAGPITFFPTVDGLDLDTNGDVVLAN